MRWDWLLAFVGSLIVVKKSGHVHELESDDKTDQSAWFSSPTIVAGVFNRRGSETKSHDHGGEESPPGRQPPPPQTKDHSTYDREIDRVSDEHSVTPSSSSPDFYSSLRSRLASLDFQNLSDTITGAIVPAWVKTLPGFIRKMQSELSMAPGSLAEEVWHDANDPEMNPEIIWNASVRVSNDLCLQEKDYLQKRKLWTKPALAKYLDIPEKDIHPDDVPVIAMCGSGGGLRAMVAGTSSYLSTQEVGLLDCITYTAGVSGSCWLQSLFFSSVGRQDYSHLIEHLKHRLGVHIAFPPAAFNLLGSAPTNKYLLSGVVEKLKGIPDAEFGLVDVYGVLLAARLLVPKGDLAINYYDLKISDQSRHVDDGRHPLPIYTAVRHEIPLTVSHNSPAQLREQARREAWFQWFEWTPYEFFCEELEAGIPTWAIGRHFDQGKTVWRENGLALPELRMPILMGIWGSAFCATLSHYYKEVRPILNGLAGFAGFDSLVTERDDDMIKVHPINPATIPNFMSNMREMLPLQCPESIHKSKHLQLMDAGMSNNLPIYPLLRPGRDVDIIITFDASADVVKDNWLKVTEGYVKQRGVKGWPVGAGWPTSEETTQQIDNELKSAQAKSANDAEERLERAKKQAAIAGDEDDGDQKGSGLDYCTVWVGTREERQAASESSLCKVVEQDWELMKPDAGITVIYFPFMSNPAVPGVNPQTSDFMSTWNFVYTPEEVDKVVDLARANFEAGQEQTKRTVRAVWQRKRDQRLEREKQLKESKWTLDPTERKLRRYNNYGDQFV